MLTFKQYLKEIGGGMITPTITGFEKWVSSPSEGEYLVYDFDVKGTKYFAVINVRPIFKKIKKGSSYEYSLSVDFGLGSFKKLTTKANPDIVKLTNIGNPLEVVGNVVGLVDRVINKDFIKHAGIPKVSGKKQPERILTKVIIRGKKEFKEDERRLHIYMKFLEKYLNKYNQKIVKKIKRKTKEDGIDIVYYSNTIEPGILLK